MATGERGANGMNAQKFVALVVKPVIGLATAHRQLMAGKIVIPMDQVTQTLKCATRKVAQVRYELKLVDICNMRKVSVTYPSGFKFSHL